MKTVKIILKFKFLTLFSDKIIQCYTESTVYTIITLFLYGIGALTKLVPMLASILITLFLYGIGAIIHLVLPTFLLLLHYSYMELEPSFTD